LAPNRKYRIILKTNVLQIILFLSIIWILSACENKDCITFSRDAVVVQFLDSANNKKDTTFSVVTSIGSNFVFYSDTTLSTYLLPVNTSESQTTFLFKSNNNETDTLQIGYERRQRFISEDCGFELQFRVVEILYTSFPNAISLNNDLSTLNETNIEIYH